MTITEASTLARVNHRSQWLYEQGYRTRKLPQLAGIPSCVMPTLLGEEHDSTMQIVEVVSPEGEEYEVSVPARVLCLAERVCPNPSGENAENAEWLDLSGELTAYQDEFNLLEIGSCSCPFWQKHRGRYWCKHYLGAPLLLAHERAAKAQEAAERMALVVEAMRSGVPLRLCSEQRHRGNLI